MKLEPIETEQYKGFTIEIHQDEAPGNPRQSFDHICQMFCLHRRYRLGDDHQYRASDFDSLAEFKECLEANLHPLLIRPLYLYDHSGLSISTGDFGDRFDSGQVGFILITQAKLDEMGVKPGFDLEACLKAEVEEYDDYLGGRVWGYVIKNEDGEELESCWGFIGDTSYVLQEARNQVDGMDSKRAKSIHGAYLEFVHVPNGQTSRQYGPFQAIQITYGILRDTENGAEIGNLGEDGRWHIRPSSDLKLKDEFVPADLAAHWTDVIISHK